MIEGLAPIVEVCTRYDTLQEDLSILERRRSAVPAFFAQHRHGPLRRAPRGAACRTTELWEVFRPPAHAAARTAPRRGQASACSAASTAPAGRSFMLLTGRIDELGRERKRRRDRATEYNGWLAQAGMETVTDSASFHERARPLPPAPGPGDENSGPRGTRRPRRQAPRRFRRD
ncbi:hypothetical protein [Streptomyces sp. Mo3]|uniref:hypothetical protein n=1 Tax=Streptomyces sp. Mo3 TaxID=3161190 RepID=UPI0039EF4C7B